MARNGDLERRTSRKPRPCGRLRRATLEPLRWRSDHRREGRLRRNDLERSVDRAAWAGGPRREAPDASAEIRGFPQGPQALRHGPEGPAVEPEGPLGTRRTAAKVPKDLVGSRRSRKHPASSRPPKGPLVRPARLSRAGRRAGSTGRPRAGMPGSRLPGRRSGHGPGGDPPGRPRVHRNGPAGLAKPRSSVRRSAIPGSRLRVTRRRSNRTPLRAEARHGARLRGRLAHRQHPGAFACPNRVAERSFPGNMKSRSKVIFLCITWITFHNVARVSPQLYPQFRIAQSPLLADPLGIGACASPPTASWGSYCGAVRARPLGGPVSLTPPVTEAK